MVNIYIIGLGLALIAAFFLGIILLPILALIRTGRIRELASRLGALEDEVARLRRMLRRREEAEAPEPERPTAEAVAPAELPEALPVTPPARRRRVLVPEDTAWLEEWIGRRGLGWAAVVLLLFATAFFLKYAFENEWIGELGRVSIGVAAGAGLCVAGFRSHRRGSRLFGQMLSAAGVVLLYLATFAAFGYYHLMPREQAAVFLVLLVIETAALAILYDATGIALMAIVGGLLNPILLRADRDQYQALFTYLIVLNLGVVAVALYRPWRAVATVALAGTQALFWGWWWENYHPEKLAAALGFQAGLFAIFLLHHGVVHVWRRRNADVEGLVRLVLNAFLFAGAGATLLWEDYRTWMGSAAVGMAIVYTSLAWLVLRRRPEDTWQQLVVVATALAFVAMVFPLQKEASAWVSVGWAVEGAALAWFGLRIRSDVLRGLGAVFLLLGVGRLLAVDMLAVRRGPFVPILNTYALPALAVAACVLFAAVSSRRMLREPRPIDRVARGIAGLGGVLLVWLILSVETYQYFSVQIPLAAAAERESLYHYARTSLSVLWPAYAALLLVLGFRLDSRPLRWTALGLFALTMAKVVLVDMAALPGFYRVAAFFVLSVIMGAAAWGYQKIERAHRAGPAEATGHDTA
jgi:uncharacterized membrane protein